MRIYVRGPHVGPVRTTSWSSGGGGSGVGGKVLAALFLPLALISLAISFARFWEWLAFLAVLVVLGLFWRHERRKQAAANQDVPESPAEHGDRR